MGIFRDTPGTQHDYPQAYAQRRLFYRQDPAPLENPLHRATHRSPAGRESLITSAGEGSVDSGAVPV